MGLAGDAPTKDALKDTRTELYELGPSSRNPEFHLGNGCTNVYHLLLESPNQSQYNCKAGRDWREDGDPDVPVPP